VDVSDSTLNYLDKTKKALDMLISDLPESHMFTIIKFSSSYTVGAVFFIENT